MYCNKCGNQPQETDKFAWKCTSCGKVYGAKLSYLRMLQERKNSSNLSLVKCKECGEPLDSGKEKIIWKCSCGNVQCSILGGYKDNDITDNELDTQNNVKNYKINSTVVDPKQKLNCKKLKNKMKYLICSGVAFIVIGIIFFLFFCLIYAKVLKMKMNPNKKKVFLMKKKLKKILCHT